MILDEAIKHAEEVAEGKEKEAWEARLQEEYKTIKSCKECAKEHRQLAEWLKELKQLREQTRWIPVSERLPEKDDLYLVFFDDGAYHLAYFNNGACDYSGVIAWMPLPKPYKAEGSGEE